MICLIYPYLICWISSVWLLLHIHNKSDILQATKLTLQQLSWKSASLYFVKKKKERKKSPEIPKLPASSSLRQHTHCLNSTTAKGKEQQRKAVGVSSQQPCDKCNNFQLVFTALELWALWSEDAFAALKVRGYTSVQMSCFIAFRFPAWTGREVRSANIYRSDCCALRRKEKKIQTYFLGSLWRFFCVLDYFECCPDIRLIISHLLKVYRL